MKYFTLFLLMVCAYGLAVVAVAFWVKMVVVPRWGRKYLASHPEEREHMEARGGIVVEKVLTARTQCDEEERILLDKASGLQAADRALYRTMIWGAVGVGVLAVILLALSIVDW